MKKKIIYVVCCKGMNPEEVRKFPFKTKTGALSHVRGLDNDFEKFEGVSCGPHRVVELKVAR